MDISTHHDNRQSVILLERIISQGTHQETQQISRHYSQSSWTLAIALQPYLIQLTNHMLSRVNLLNVSLAKAINKKTCSSVSFPLQVNFVISGNFFFQKPVMCRANPYKFLVGGKSTKRYTQFLDMFRSVSRRFSCCTCPFLDLTRNGSKHVVQKCVDRFVVVN